jgi:hypothetical protein
MANYNTADLIDIVKNLETIPDSGAAYSDATLLQYLDQSMKGFIVPAIESTCEEHFVVTIDFQMGEQPPYNGVSPPVDVNNWVMIPPTATGLRLRDAFIIGKDGSFYNLSRLTAGQAASMSFGNVYWGPGYSNQTQGVAGFFLQGNQVQIYPYGFASGKMLRLLFQRAPADLCLTTDAGQVTNIVGDVVTLDKVLPWYGTAQIGHTPTRVNAMSNDSPNEYIQDARVPVTVYTSYTPLDDMTLTSAVGNVITLPAGAGVNIQIGDWICQHGSAVFAQNIPKEILPALCRKAGEMCLEAAGDKEGQQIAMQTYTSMIKMALAQIAPRVVGKPVKILPTNSVFRAARNSTWGRW